MGRPRAVSRPPLPPPPTASLARRRLRRGALKGPAERPAPPLPPPPPPTPLTPLIDAVEAELAAIWAQVLGRHDLGREDSFFDLGGHSLAAVRLMARIRERFGCELPLAVLYRAATIERLAVLLRAGSGPAVRSALVELTPAADGARGAGSRQARPLFCVHPPGGNAPCSADLPRPPRPHPPPPPPHLPHPPPPA